MRHIPIVVICLLGLARAASAQTNVEVTQGVPFDFINPGARSLAMGGAFVGAADDATAALTNPAGLRALSKSEISFEGRQTDLQTPFVFGGRLNGTLSNRGVDRTNGPIFEDAPYSEFRPVFVSAVYASAGKPWAIAGFRHETSTFTRGITTDGAFAQYTVGTNNGNGFRYFPVIGNMSLEIVNYGVAGSFKFQSCDSVGTVKSCEDRFAVGGGFSYYTFSIDSLTSRYNVTAAAAGDPAGSFYGPASYSRNINYQTEVGEGNEMAATVGLLYLPHRRLQIGFSYRKGVQFSYTAQNYVVGTTSDTPQNQNTDATFRVPDALAVGIATRLGAGTMIVADVRQVKYSQLMDGFISVFQGEAASEFTQPPHYHADDATEIHVGIEHQFLGARIAPAIRFGAWFDPDHAIYNDLPESLFQPGKDVWHITGGGGVVLKALEIGVGYDHSDRGSVLSTSAVVRF